MKEEGLDGPKLMQELIFMVKTMTSGLTVNMDKTKLMEIKALQPRNYPLLHTIDKNYKMVQSFKYIGLMSH